MRHTVEVMAESLYEAAILGVGLFRQDGWAEPIAPGAPLEIQVREPATSHVVTVAQLRGWVDGVAVSPDETLKKRQTEDAVGDEMSSASDEACARQAPLASISRLHRAADQLRRRVNYPRRHLALMRVADQYHTICSAMDVVGDTSQALRAFFEHPALPANDSGPAYLLAYGTLHALYLQQDAVFWLCKLLDVKPATDYDGPGAWARSIPALERARTARNDSTGHPVRRDLPKSAPVASFFIVQHSLSASGFQLIEHDDRGRTEFRSVSFPSLIADQIQQITGIIEQACSELDASDRQHYTRFMDKPLTPILASLNYNVEKLGAAPSEERAFMGACATSVKQGLDALKAAIEERDEPFDAFWQCEYQKLFHALHLLGEYSAGSSKDDVLADLLAGYVRYALDDLKKATAEIDDRYAGD